MKTTVYLPEDLKRRLALLARERETTEAALVREAVERLVASGQPKPRLGFLSSGDPTLAERVDEELATGYGVE